MVSLGTEMARNCSELTFKMTATNRVGVSSPGQVSGGFPVGKLFFPFVIPHFSMHASELLSTILIETSS